MNRELEQMLRSYVSPRLDDWDEHLDMCELAIDSAWSSAVKASPVELVLSQNPKIHMALIEVGSVLKTTSATREHAAKIMTARVSEAVDHARRCMAEAQQRHKANADAHRRDLEFEVGEQVLLSIRNMRMHGAGKGTVATFCGATPGRQARGQSGV